MESDTSIEKLLDEQTLIAEESELETHPSVEISLDELILISDPRPAPGSRRDGKVMET